MAGINFGIAFGNALSSGIKTYADLQQLQMKQAEFKQQQDQWGREDQERQAASQGAQGTTTAVTPGTLAQQMQGADGKADGDAVMSTYGAIQDPTQAPSVTKNAIAGGVMQGQMANDSAGQGDKAIQYAQRVDTPGIPAAPQAPVAQGAPAGFNAPSGNPLDTATQYVRAQEGGYVANDNGKGPTNFGINGLANGMTPDQVKNLKPGDADAIYKAKYFSGANGGVDISKLPTAAAVAVGDTAANMGQGTAGKLWQQSGGDLQKFLDLRQQAYDNIKADDSTHAVWNKRMASIREFVNQHGTSETVPGDSSGMPVAPQTKVVQLDAKPVSGGATGIGDTVTFTHDENGNVQMTKADTSADALMRMATKAFQVGDMKNGPTLMNAAIQARAAQAQQQVSSILTNDKLDQDSKVAQLANMAGAKAYKTEQGNYIIPGLGPVDQRGNPMPMTMTQVGALSSQMATPDGLHHIVETQIAMQKLSNEGRTADQKDTELGIEQQKANQSGDLTKAETTLYQKRGANYDAETAASNDAKSAQAAERNERANISAKLQDLEQQASRLDPKAPDYMQQISQIRLQHDMLLSRASGKPGSSVDAKPEKLQDGETRAYKNPDGSTEIRTFNAAAGAEIPAQQEPLIRQGIADMKSDPDTYKGVIAGQNGGKWGFGLDPAIAKNYGLNPDAAYRTPQDAVSALRAAKVTRNPTANPFASGGIPQAPSVSDYTPGG